MSYPLQVPSVYINSQGDLVASGLYRSYLTQDIANDFPSWMSIRNCSTSVGQQFLASEAILMEWLQNDLEYNIRSKFLDTSPLDDIDVLYSCPVPSTINLLNADASGITCIAAPSGYSLISGGEFYVTEVGLLEDFYYNVLPTRMEITCSGAYVGEKNGTNFNIIPSGILDKQQKRYDRWKNVHNITWCASSGQILKQDAYTQETYEAYAWNDTGNIVDLWYNNGYLWALAEDVDGSYVSLLSSKTQEPPAAELDYLARFDFSVALPSGTLLQNIMVDASGFMWVADNQQISVWGIAPRYDYFIFDPTTRAVYFREDYSDSGVFLSNT